MAFLGMNPQFKAYNQSPLYEAVGGEVVLPIKVMSPDSILIKNGATTHNPTDWTIESDTNKVSLKVPAAAGDQYSVMNLASFSVADMVSKSSKSQEIMSSPKVVDTPTDHKQLTTVGQMYKSDSSKNMIINPCFVVNQRTVVGLTSHLSMTSAGAFADCWKHATAIASGGPTPTFTHQRITSGDAIDDFMSGKIPTPYYGTIKHVLSTYTPTVRATTAIAQRLEDYGWAAGEEVTFSFYARCPAGATVIGVAVGNVGIDSDVYTKYPLIKRVNLSTEWKRYEFTFTMPTIDDKVMVATKRLSIEFCLNSINDDTNIIYSTITNSNEIHLTGIMLEKGDVASEFHARPSQEELNLCYRYLYCRNHVLLNSYVDSSTVSSRCANIDFPQCMIAQPTLIGSSESNSGSSGTVRYYYLSATGATVVADNSNISYTAANAVSAFNLVFSAEL